jgi:large subunit ribosomal protein L15
MQQHELKPPAGARHARRRVGCGRGSGHGKTSGRGHKGQGARSGGGVRPGFEGGQTPLYRRLPRRGFNNYRFASEFDVVNVGCLDVFNPQDEIDTAVLKDRGLVRGARGAMLKILGDGELKIPLKVRAHKFSASARAKIEAAGGECLVIEVSTPAEAQAKAAEPEAKAAEPETKAAEPETKAAEPEAKAAEPETKAAEQADEQPEAKVEEQADEQPEAADDEATPDA